MLRLPRRPARLLLGLALGCSLAGCGSSTDSRNDGKRLQLTDEEVKAIARADSETAEEEQGKKIIQGSKKAAGKKAGKRAARADEE
ncbi:hypothetical protein [Aquisphaera insulae]|uniref:hypothetical protein n=1 Tax=Aquisphaera insulae TaxID=2712864 RepID=UPI0013EC4B68|nr:hypothetical protein [Aquisphaera insulae]